ncbi:hypothetical protein AcW2_005770 [Taiwanofungus camphoratus]|nr:hypothetical protein AcW2_005770 [Antrodia cinnamomea]
MPPVQDSADRYPHTQRAVPSGPRRLPDVPRAKSPIRHSTYDSSTTTASPVEPFAQRSRTLDAYCSPHGRGIDGSSTSLKYATGRPSHNIDPSGRNEHKVSMISTSIKMNSPTISPTYVVSSPLSHGCMSGSGSSSPRRNPPSEMSPTSHEQSLGLSASLHPYTHDQAVSAFASHARSAPQSRKSSGASTDRDTGAHLDLKRLLSKPAIHAASSSSAVSIPSDSEISASSRYLDVGNAAGGTMPRARSVSAHHHPVLQAAKSDSPSRSSSSHRPGSRDTSPLPREVEHEKGASQSQVPKQRNVLKRRPSRSTSNAPRPNVADPLDPAPLPRPTTMKRRMRSIEAFHAIVPHRSASALAGGKSSSRQKDASGPPALTPAGQVAQAYKQQEQRREELAELSGWNDHVWQVAESARTRTPAPRSPDSDSARTQKTDEVQGHGEETTSGPYYTVFGSSSGHVVAVGSPHDYSSQLDQYYPADELARRVGATDTRRSLSRKVSGKFKKAAGMSKKDRELSPHPIAGEVEYHGRNPDSWRPYDGQSITRRRSGSLPKSPRATIRPSMDDYVDVAAPTWNSCRSMPTARNGVSETGQSADDGQGKQVHSLRTVKSVKSKDREVRDDPQAGGKWWKLVKRISTGGLRDKYRQPRGTTPPPVPALPVDLQKLVTSRSTFDIQKSSGREGSGDDDVLSRFMQSRSSLSGVRPLTVSQKTPPRTTGSRPSTAKTSASVPRVSTTTRSSSPVSSDIASSSLFHKAHSTRSSASSYGEEVPPMPTNLKTNLAQYIVPPSELCRLESDFGREHVATSNKPRVFVRAQSEPVDDHRCYSSADESMPSLPLPPRRPNTGYHERRERSPSLIVPSFSTEDAVNNFTPSSLPLSEFGTAPSGPPSRPRRSTRRKPVSIDVPSPSISTAQSPHTLSPRTPRTPRAPPSMDMGISNRTSTGALSYASTAKQASLSPSSSVLPSSTASQQRSPLNFRELESPRQAWTEQEKADKWDDLLQRSARAGGTLHIGETGLLSETMNLSQDSEI